MVMLGVAAVFVVGLVALWAVPLWLTRHPSVGLGAAERLKAVNDARGSVIAFLVVMGTGGTLVFTARTFQLNRAGQVAERYTRAVDQLGAETLEKRIGGVYGLESIGVNSVTARRTVIYVLGAFVRSRSACSRGPEEEPAEDVYAALRVVSRLAPETDVVVNLRNADLRNARLLFMNRVNVRLDGAELTGAVLPDTWTALVAPLGHSADSGDPETVASSSESS
ncbi:hypothetical protein [Paractinoplanes hotanensis]|uniref:Uncharacterized protein n=1 Tax=Paractinoplanes hotanensis TaxID=2906497 RepID=A0ABT0Y4H2_9ACTN|nr:hypothetical protein [Actinoplanes hotanensis]MCM4080938.1 hypothetical protein [Actinoplanes hotanensis]